MAILNDDMKRVVIERRLEFVARVNKSCTPNLSPKGTMMVCNDDSIMFAKICSPQSIANLKRNTAAEINFVDSISRKDYRFKSRLRLVSPSDDEYDELSGRSASWGPLTERVNAVVILEIEQANKVTSPAYDIGTAEEALRAKWLGYFQSI
jgi:hypothetical protein